MTYYIIKYLSSSFAMAGGKGIHLSNCPLLVNLTSYMPFICSNKFLLRKFYSLSQIRFYVDFLLFF